jgi:cyclopropane-fatty-acyl-phospholipid synthase
MSLEAGQRAKMHHVCRKLCLEPGQEVFEAGCGWGGLALFMAREYGVRVKAYNISHEQIVFARERAREVGLQDQVEYIEDDYRNIDGRCDVFVSIGMLEHVGVGHYHELGGVIDRVLKPGGSGLIHSIGRNRPQRMNSWIEARIFPGAYPPTLSEMAPIFEAGNFAIQDVENLRLHYAETLRHWRDRFETHHAEVEELYDPYFVRAWRLYLSGSIAAFTCGALQLFQVRFNRAGGNNLPRSRAHLYSGDVAIGFDHG